MGYKFRRQQPVGRYVVDFCCLGKKLIIELDGGQHASQIKADRQRTKFLESEGFQVVRFWDNEVFQNLNGVIEKILECINHPHPALGTAPSAPQVPRALRAASPQGRGKKENSEGLVNLGGQINAK